MHELRDDYCPFCRTSGTVEFYENATSVYGKLYKCRLCTAVFDARQKDQEERIQRKKQQEKLEAMREEESVHVRLPPVKKSSLLAKVIILTTVILIIAFFT